MEFPPRTSPPPPACCPRSATDWSVPDVNMQMKTAQLKEADPTAPGAAPSPRPSARRRRGIARLLSLVGIVALLGYLAYPWLHARWTHVTLDDARVAASMVTVSSEVSGRITSLGVIAGDTV